MSSKPSLPTINQDTSDIRPYVQGKCPSCGEETLVLNADGKIVCRYTSCAQPNTATVILCNHDDSHQVRLTSTGYNAQHPLIERINNKLFDCEFDKYMRTLTEQPMPSGEYSVKYIKLGGLQGMWQWTREPNRG